MQVFSQISRCLFDLCQVAGNHGRAVGATIAGQPKPFVKVPVFWSARMYYCCCVWLLTHFFQEGQQLRYCGYGMGYDDVIIKGDPGAMKVGLVLVC